MAIENILCIGGHGDLGRPVVRRMHEAGFNVRLMVREPSKVEGLFPFDVEVVQGNLRDEETIRDAASGMDAVYLNLSTRNTKASFKEELDGTRNTIEALADKNEILICKLSSLGAEPNRFWRDQDQKWQAEQDIINSGHPYILFKPSWFMESLPMFTYKGKFSLFGKGESPMCWIAGDDYGRQVCNALKDASKWNRSWDVQGKVRLGMKEAAEKYIEAKGDQVSISSVPLLMLRVLGLFHGVMEDFYQLIKHTTTNEEEFVSEETWRELGEPEFDILAYVEYCKKHNDWPSKRN